MNNYPIQLIHGSLFSGIGGFDFASQLMGWKNAFHCEWNKFGQKVLKYYWPNAISYGDITKTDFTIHRGAIDVLTGGFPCQPYSTAGKRLGKEDERHRWPEMLRAIREIQAPWVVGENVSGIVNWNGGMVFEEVQADMENEGYEVIPFLLPACGVGAPHKRERVWFVAYSHKCAERSPRTGGGIIGERSNNYDEPKERGEQAEQHNRYGNVHGIDSDSNVTSTENEIQARRNELVGETTANSNKLNGNFSGLCSSGFSQFEKTGIFGNNVADSGCIERENWIHGEKQEWKATEFGNSYSKFGQFSEFPTVKPTICGRNDGISRRLDGITFPKWRNESIKAYGNAIVPQVAYQIFKAIDSYNSLI